jgi:hypothetical protein
MSAAAPMSGRPPGPSRQGRHRRVAKVAVRAAATFDQGDQAAH